MQMKYHATIGATVVDAEQAEKLSDEWSDIYAGPDTIAPNVIRFDLLPDEAFTTEDAPKRRGRPPKAE